MARRPLRWTRLALLGLFVVAALPAQQAGSPPPPPCQGEEHRRFDFWLGDWDVEAGGQVRGRNRITRLYGDCGLREEYTTVNGRYVGSSFNVYDAPRGVWHQTWVDNQGLLLMIEGGWRDGAMVLQGSLTGKDGSETLQRITWTPGADGTVRQEWQSSADGSTWSTVFDGLYRRRTAAP
jgi:hypothetical protein